jgi:hypothetical protein
MSPDIKKSRRDFLKLTGLAAGGAALAACTRTNAITPGSPEATKTVPVTKISTNAPTATPIETAVVLPTVVPTEQSTQAPTEAPFRPNELTREQLAEKKLYGSGFELKTQFQGMPVDITVVVSDAVLKQYNQTEGCFPNQEMKKYGHQLEIEWQRRLCWGIMLAGFETEVTQRNNIPLNNI